MSDNAVTYDVVFVKGDPDRPGKHFWPKVGRAWLDSTTGRVDIRIDSIPLGFDGHLMLFPKRPTGEKGSSTDG